MNLLSCREKKDTEVQVLETSKDVESETISDLEQKNEELREKLAGKRFITINWWIENNFVRFEMKDKILLA